MYFDLFCSSALSSISNDNVWLEIVSSGIMNDDDDDDDDDDDCVFRSFPAPNHRGFLTHPGK